MGLPYLNAQEIQQQKKLVAVAIAHKPNFFIRSGEILLLVKQKVRTDSRILEVGAGGGDLAKSLLDNNYVNLDLLDIDDYLREDIKTKVKLSLADVSRDKLPYGDNYFDLVLAIAIVEHLENPYHFTREAARVLKPGGQMFMAIPYIFSWRSRLRFLWRGDLMGYSKNNNHITYFTKAVFDKVFSPHFKVKQIIYGESYIEIFGKKIKFNIGGKFFSNKILYILEKIK